MRPPDGKENGAGAPTPNPNAAALQTTAHATYLESLPEGKRNGQWVAVPRPLVELMIDLRIDCLDLNDRLAMAAQGSGESPENAL